MAALALGVSGAGPALAQTIIQTPGEPPATVTQWGNTTIIQRPGEPATTITSWGDTDIVQTPGQPMTTITRFDRGPNKDNSK